MNAFVRRVLGLLALAAACTFSSARADDHVLWWEIWDNVTIQGKGATTFASLGVDSARVRVTEGDGTTSILPLYFDEGDGILTLSPYTVVEAPGDGIFFASLGVELHSDATLTLELGAWSADDTFWCVAATAPTPVSALSDAITDADDLLFGGEPGRIWSPSEFVVVDEEPGDLERAADGVSKFDIVTMYDGVEHGLDVAAFDRIRVAGEPVEVSFSESSEGPWSTTSPTLKNVGEKSVWYKLTAPGYLGYTHEARISVTNRCVSLTSADAVWTFDGQSHCHPTVTVGGQGFVAGEGVTFDSFAAIVNVGTQSNTFSFVCQENTLARNYCFDVIAGTLTVEPCDFGSLTEAAQWQVVFADDVGAYDGTEKTCTISSATYGSLPLTFTVSENRQTNAGAYSLTLTGTGNFVGTHTVNWSIAPRTLTNAMWTDLPTVTYSGVAFEPSVLLTDEPPSSLTTNDYTVAYADNVNAGSAKVTVTGRGNYTGVLEKSFTIAKRPVILASASASKAYDGTALAAESVEAGGEGFANGEGASYSGFATITAVGTCENSFSYELAEGTLADNYEITVRNGTLTVSAAAIGTDDAEPGEGTVPEGGVSKYDAAATYDGAGHAPDAAALAALTVSASTVTASYSLSSEGPWQAEPPAFTNAGVHEVWYRLSAPNYADYVHAARVTIAKRPVTVTAEGKEQVEGAAEVPLTYEVEGLCAGDELTGSLTREPGLTVGSYAILLGSLTNRNYEISFVGANYVIVAPVIVPDELKDRKVFDEFKNWLVSQMYLTETATDAQVVEMADSVVPLKGGTLLAEFIAGTDPADINSRLRALISMEGTRPIIRWEPALNGPGVRTGVRIYRVWGAKTCRGPWIELAEGDELEKDVRFFKVSVGLP